MIKSSEVLKRIRKSEKDFKDSTGLPALLYSDAKFQKILAKAIEVHGTNGSKVYQEVRDKGIVLTKKQIQVYLRRLFGSYNQKGRPPKYLERDMMRKAIKKNKIRRK
jgi:hypothetical protein